MYTKEQLPKIIEDFLDSDFSKLKRGTTKALIEVEKQWPGLMSSTKVLSYWINCCRESTFIDSLFCNQCGKFMSNKEYGWPKYCSKECRSLNHNWKGGSEKRIALEQKWEDKYGCKNPWGAKEVRDKIKATNLERYGSEHNWGRNSTVWDKIKETNLEKYGTEYIVQSKHFKEKSKETMIEHYGVDNPMKSKELREKAQKTNIERYGAPCNFNSGSIIREHLIQKCLKDYGVPYYCMIDKCKENLKTLISKVNKDFKSKLDALDINSIFEKQVGWYSYDLFIESQNLLIDINPSFTHSATPGISNFKPKPKEYHYMRFKNAIVNGYKLLQIWDWDNTEKILENLKERQSVGARQCELKCISKQDANNFCNAYHYQNTTKALTHAYGLFYENELVEVMTFGKPRYNKQYQYELLRLCTKPKFTILGGASKLLKVFEKEHNPESMISYCDLSKFDGKIYETLGFTESSYAISKHWYNCYKHKHFTDNLLRQLGADKLIGTDFGKGTSNEQIMLDNHFIEVYDAGQKTYVKEYKY